MLIFNDLHTMTACAIVQARYVGIQDFYINECCMTSRDHPSFDDYEQTNRRPQAESLACNLQLQQPLYTAGDVVLDVQHPPRTSKTITDLHRTETVYITFRVSRQQFQSATKLQVIYVTWKIRSTRVGTKGFGNTRSPYMNSSYVRR